MQTTILADSSADPDSEALALAPAGPRFEADDLPPLARAAADIFAARLKLSHVGPDDDFFALGGGRIAAGSVARRLERAIGRPVSPALIFHARTPRRLGEALESQRQAETSHLVDLCVGGDAPELFCMPEVYGRPMSFITLADRLGPALPVVGLAVGPAASHLVASRSMDALAPAYVAAIRERRPVGPYRLAGYSFGGTFAQEVARLLHERGEDVSLILIDAPNRVAPLRPARMAVMGPVNLVRAMRREGFRPAAARAKRTLLALPGYVRGAREADIPSWVPSVDREIAAAHAAAWRRHAPKPFHGRTLMVVCREQVDLNMFRNVDGMIGWRGLLKGPIRRIVAETGHQEVVREDYVDRLADHIRGFLGDPI